jgi:hypothetical protein
MARTRKIFVRHFSIMSILSFFAVCCCNPITPMSEFDIAKEQLTKNAWERRCTTGLINQDTSICYAVRTDPQLTKFRSDGYLELYNKSKPNSNSKTRWSLSPVKVKIDGRELFVITYTSPPSPPFFDSVAQDYIVTLTKDSLTLAGSNLGLSVKTILTRY